MGKGAFLEPLRNPMAAAPRQEDTNSLGSPCISPELRQRFAESCPRDSIKSVGVSVAENTTVQGQLIQRLHSSCFTFTTDR